MDVVNEKQPTIKMLKIKMDINIKEYECFFNNIESKFDCNELSNITGCVSILNELKEEFVFIGSTMKSAYKMINIHMYIIQGRIV